VDVGKLTYTANDSTADGSQFVVSVQYDARNLPIWNLFPGIAMPGTTITRQSTIRVGGI
jgi:Flp pilus assembly protein TadG